MDDFVCFFSIRISCKIGLSNQFLFFVVGMLIYSHAIQKMLYFCLLKYFPGWRTIRTCHAIQWVQVFLPLGEKSQGGGANGGEHFVSYHQQLFYVQTHMNGFSRDFQWRFRVQWIIGKSDGMRQTTIMQSFTASFIIYNFGWVCVEYTSSHRMTRITHAEHTPTQPTQPTRGNA